ncbi:hypothetical protein AXX17_AT5G64350 [Arabidopsis thaliana]|uniref:J domain-containing protein n=1 Tax=Arabidopsis thaliana TaxID=3702 RepID=A0A178ULC4_ARATH|nr:hypothetical protein AXX17_AT5G64350 [Arabidopsis thaliana]
MLKRLYTIFSSTPKEVEIFFRSAALKWHPDKHPGPSQEHKRSSNSALMHINHSVLHSLDLLQRNKLMSKQSFEYLLNG